MSKFQLGKFEILPATQEDIEYVFSFPNQFKNLWEDKNGHRHIIENSRHVLKTEIDGKPAGVCGVLPVCFLGNAAWVWVRSPKITALSFLYRRCAPLYIDTVLRYYYPRLLATIRTPRAEKYARFLGFAPDPDPDRFNLGPGLKVYVKEQYNG